MKFAELHLKKGASPFVPFVLGINGEKREMIALADVTGNQVLPAGLKAIAERTFECAVFCYDGFITLGDRRSDAVYAIACERGEQKANIFARLYQPKAFLRPFRSLGEEARYGIIDNPLA